MSSTSVIVYGTKLSESIEKLPLRAIKCTKICYPSGAPEFTSTLPIVSGVRITRSLVLCVMIFRSLFVLFLLDIVLSVVLLRDSDYPFGIVKLLFTMSTYF